MSKVNRIKCTAKISGMMDEYYASMNERKHLAWCMGPVPYELIQAMGVSCFQSESSSARISGGHDQAPFIEYGQANGVNADICSYAKINLGLVLMQENGKMDEIDPRYRLPRPDMIISSDACPSMMQWAKCLGEIYQCPVFIFDLPFEYSGKVEDIKENMKYVKEESLKLVDFIAGVTGNTVDWDAFNKQMREIQEMSKYRRKIRELCKNIPAPASFIDNAVSMTPSISMRNQKAADFYKEFAEEVEQRVKDGIGSCQNEKYRLMWRGNFPWFRLGVLSRLLGKYDAVIVSGTYAFMTYGDMGSDILMPDGFDENDPLMSVAAENACGNYMLNTERKWRDEFQKYIEDFHIDGVIIQAPHTCRPWTLGTRDYARRVKEEYGIPAIVLEADHTDESYFNDAQVETRIQALLEEIDYCREKAAER